MQSTYKTLGKYIQLVDERNYGLKVKKLLGLSISKQFIPSVANIIGTDMENYKIIRKNQFACSTMQVRRDKKMPVALLQDFEEAIISPAYPIFEVKITEELLPEYLMMWFTRQEFDREACYYAIGGVRGSLEWEDFCDMKLPVPHIDKQKEIVKEYHTIINRIALNNQLIKKLEETAQAIYKQWFVDFEFPDADGKPYKSNGRQMEFNEELEKELPKGWDYKQIRELSIIKAGGDKPKFFSFNMLDNCKIPVYSNSSVNEGLFGFTNKASIFGKSITVSARGAIIGYTVLRTEPFVPIIRLIVVTPKQEYQLNYLFYCIKGFKYNDSGSAQGQLTAPEISSFKVIIPDIGTLKIFQKITWEFLRRVEIKKNKNLKLEALKDLLLSKLATIEDLVPEEELATIEN